MKHDKVPMFEQSLRHSELQPTCVAVHLTPLCSNSASAVLQFCTLMLAVTCK